MLWTCNRHVDNRIVPSQEILPEHISFNLNIKPILEKSCIRCHTNDGAAPFPLRSHFDFKRKASTIAYVLQYGIMPPWPADTNYQRYVSEHIISNYDRKLLLKYLSNGCNDTDATHEKANDRATANKLNSTYRELTFPSIPIQGNNKDAFLMFKIKLNLPQDTFIDRIEIVPDHKKIVHHVNLHLLQYVEKDQPRLLTSDASVDMDQHDKLTAYQKLGIPTASGQFPMLTPSVANYLPGAESYRLPNGIGGYFVKKNSYLLIDNIHYGPSNKQLSDKSKIRIYFASQPPKRPMRELIIGTGGTGRLTNTVGGSSVPLFIPAHHIDTFILTQKIEKPISLINVNPHMHLLGKYFEAFAIQNGDTIPLIKIKKWDFRWQYFYTFKKIISLMPGAIIYIKGIFDNTAANPLNPNDPPIGVGERKMSMRTTDEMFQLNINYIDYQLGDENISLQ
ncbi:MAG: hypothetical protein RIQ89_1698 [Bacteroidota bacterium]|jgi:hypothetical protein